MLSSIDIPSSCFTQTWVSTPPGDLKPGLLIGNPYDTRCFPVGVGVTISPAQCPQGYVSACAPTNILIPGETVYDCCPNGYSCDGGFYKCTSAIGGTVTLTVTDVDAAQKPILKTTVTDGMNAHSLRVRFADSDLVSTTTTSSSNAATSNTSATPSSTTSLATSTSAPSDSPSNSPSEGLSTGAKAGIGVGVGVGALAILAIALFLFKRRGRKDGRMAELDDNSAFRPSPLPTPTPQKQLSELDNVTPPTPIPTPQKYPSELDNGNPPFVHEMESPDNRFEGHR